MNHTLQFIAYPMRIIFKGWAFGMIFSYYPAEQYPGRNKITNQRFLAF